ncbi:Protein of unknown function [Bacillus cereus]|nr:Protein of unknown function [Bacillus cereus]
MVGSAVNK